MGINKSKLQCLVLPAQSGKTRKVEEEIKKFSCINSLFGHPGDLNIWISANNKLLVHQTTKRMQTDLCSSDDDAESDAVIKGNVFSWTSGTKKTNISSRELAWEVIEDRVEMIILCAHATRLRYLKDLIEHLNASKHFGKKINIWIDEADFSINLWSKYPEILNIPSVQQVTLVSATIDDIVKQMKKIRILPYQVTHPACYRRLKDMTRVVEECLASSPVEYVKHVLHKHKELSAPGMRAFIPGDFTKESHEEIAEFLISSGFAVIIINGDCKEIRIPHQDPIDLKPYLTVTDEIPDEFSDTLARFCSDPENGLDRLPLAITGFMCVERGITFQCKPTDEHDGFLFDYGIIPPIANKAEAYQTMARLFGNIGEFPGYKPCKIFTNSATFKRVENQEEIAVNLARLVHESNLTEIGPEHLKEATDPEEYNRKEVPIVVHMPSAVIDAINAMTPKEKQNKNLLGFLKQTHPEVASYLHTYRNVKTICPDSEYSKKRHIDMNLHAAARGQKITFNLKPEQKLFNNWQCILDKEGERAIFIIYHGEKGRCGAASAAASCSNAAASTNPFD